MARAVAAGEGVGDIPKSPAVEGFGTVGVSFIGSKRRRDVDVEEDGEEEED